MNYILLLQGALLAQAPAGNAKEGNFLFTIMPIVAIAFLFYFLMIRPQRREQNTRQSMINNLKKNDRIITVGGIYGVVTNVHREKDEVTINVDEGSNTKLRVTLGSIARVLSEDTPSSGSDSTSK